MSSINILIYIAVMAGVTYLVRMLPLVLIKKNIKNKYILSFLYYMPYAVLGAMTFPAILFSTTWVLSAIVGLIVAVVTACKKQSLITVALSACVAVLIAEAVMKNILI